MRYRNRCKDGGSNKGSEEQLCHWDLQKTHLRRQALDDHMQLPMEAYMGCKGSCCLHTVLKCSLVFLVINGQQHL